MGAIKHFFRFIRGAIDPFSKANDTTPAFLKHTQLCEWQLEGAIHKLLLLEGAIKDFFLKFIRAGKRSIFKR